MNPPRDNSWNISCWVTVCSMVSQILKEIAVIHCQHVLIGNCLGVLIISLICARKETKDTIYSKCEYHSKSSRRGKPPHAAI